MIGELAIAALTANTPNRTTPQTFNEVINDHPMSATLGTGKTNAKGADSYNKSTEKKENYSR